MSPPPPASLPAHTAPAHRAAASHPATPLLPAHTRSNPIVVALVWIIVLGGLCVAGFFAYRYYTSSQQTASGKGPGGHGGERPSPVVIDTAHTGDMKLYIEQVGNVSAYNTVTVRTRIDGELQKVAFTEGQMVREGDVLFEIDPRPYIVQLTQAQGQLAKDQATMENAGRDVERYHRAAEAVSEQQITAADAAYATAKGAVEVDKGVIDAAKLSITYCTITAPITGRIGLRMVDQGNMVHASDANGLAVITQLQPISVLFSPREDELPRVQKARLTTPRLPVEAMDRTFKHLADGVVESLDNQIDPTTATFRVKAVFANEDNMLFPLQLVNVRLLVETLHDVVLVPDAAVQLSPQGHFCYVMKDDDTVEMRMVTTGDSQDKFTVIKKGVSSGETVVTEGVDKLQPGAKVVPHTAAEEAASQPSTQAESQPATHPKGGKKKMTNDK